MALPGRITGLLEATVTRRTLAAVASGTLHLAIVLAALFFGGRQDGLGSSDQPALQLVLVEAPDVDRTEGIELAPLEPTVTSALLAEEFELIEPAPALPPAESVNTEPAGGHSAPAELAVQLPAIDLIESVQQAQVLQASAEERAALPEKLAHLVGEMAGAPETQVQWEENGKQYSAKLVWERAKDGTALEHVIAQVSAADRGKVMSTRIMLKRLAFSHFSQVVDRWDPLVQMHDDLIVGRFHSNSRFNVRHDSLGGPKVLGKVTTAARSFEMHASGRHRQSEMFPGGVQTRARPIDLPDEVQPFAWAPEDENCRIHELTDDTRIRFFPDGSYTWRTRGASGPGYLNSPSEHPVYFIATPGTSVYVQGTVAGKVLVYSPTRIVIEDDLRYATDPRENPHSRDYLGLVSGKYVEIAPPGVTGPGDLEIQAAIFAGRRFLVRDIKHWRTATLRIYGSLSAGSLSASEPRYATKIEYDERFERQRPPGFPLTSRFEAEQWDGQWIEATHSPERIAEETF
jgi:hypothetical protein